MSRARVAALLRAGTRFAVTCHRRPDPDAMGSALGWAAILEALGHEACVYSVDPSPRSLDFLPETGRVHAGPPGGTWDACFVMDAAAESLFPPMPDGLAGPIVVVDHHAVHDDYGDVIVREPDACATGLVVVRLMRELGLTTFPKEAVGPLYAAIVSDTGGFRYDSTTVETHRVAADLLELGADPWLTASHLFERWELPRMKLLAELLSGMSLELDCRLAVLKVSDQALTRLGADAEMVEGMVNFGRMLRSVEIAALLWQQDDGSTKLSFRASRDVNVARLAQSFGGGGHRAAAGARSDEAIDAIHARVRRLAAEALGST